MDTQSSLKKANTIAYDKILREYLEDLNSTLDIGITDLSAQTVRLTIKFKEDAVKQLKFMSKLTADLSVALIKAKGDKDLKTEEQEQFDTIKNLADLLGNLQFKINRLIMDMTTMESLGEKISGESEVILESTMELQTKLMNIRVEINDFGFFSHDPAIARLFNGQDEQ